jgi:uncharacterized protein YndB with AHSA1/START domain
VYTLSTWTADLRPGGRWKSEGKGADGHSFSVEGEYLRVEPPRLIVQTWQPSWDGGNSTTIHYELEPIEGGTRLTVRHEGFGDRAAACEDHGRGWVRVIGWLVAHLEAPRRTFLCRLIPPRPSFAQDMSPEERAMMGEHASYWRDLIEKRVAVAFGPVADPAGFWGMALIVVSDEAEARRVTDADPAIRANRGLHYQILPLASAVLRG